MLVLLDSTHIPLSVIPVVLSCVTSGNTSYYNVLVVGGTQLPLQQQSVNSIGIYYYSQIKCCVFEKLINFSWCQGNPYDHECW